MHEIKSLEFFQVFVRNQKTQKIQPVLSKEILCQAIRKRTTNLAVNHTVLLRCNCIMVTSGFVPSVKPNPPDLPRHSLVRIDRIEL